jgi:transposase
VAITNNEEAFVQSVEGNVNGQTFNEFMAFALADAPPFTVVILDNIAFHKSAAVRRIAEQHGVRLLYTPGTSWNTMNPTLSWGDEKAWSSSRHAYVQC